MPDLTSTWFDTAPQPTSGYCRRHGDHPLWRWTVARGPEDRHLLTGTCLVEDGGEVCGAGAQHWHDGEDVSFLLIRCRLRCAAWTQVGRVSVDMGVDEDGNPRPALVLRAACDLAQSQAREMVA